MKTIQMGTTDIPATIRITPTLRQAGPAVMGLAPATEGAAVRVSTAALAAEGEILVLMGGVEAMVDTAAPIQAELVVMVVMAAKGLNVGGKVEMVALATMVDAVVVEEIRQERTVKVEMVEMAVSRLMVSVAQAGAEVMGLVLIVVAVMVGMVGIQS